MNGLAKYFMLLGVLAAIIGMAWGIQMSASGNHMMAAAHAHLNLLGWVSFALFAFYYHSVPAAAGGMLARIHAAVATLGLVTIVPGIVMALNHSGETLAKLGSVLTLLSMLTFAVVVLTSGRGRG
ncbi:hypothetical protein [Pseudodonghicola flavimaris]|uniref:Uncharacterized protein n=1 Tax=Pseudodonghicola flavimaris TaxID=3050036 RepID=A0ABT7EZA2_9RHOB|nr:hypothetical protein [Pseudodonghicola flavimaris]MDK3017692.1 hypothetical protein [Pseudodonghicola flavimaris]